MGFLGILKKFLGINQKLNLKDFYSILSVIKTKLLIFFNFETKFPKWDFGYLEKFVGNSTKT